jgi:hypothetical protein
MNNNLTIEERQGKIVEGLTLLVRDNLDGFNDEDTHNKINFSGEVMSIAKSLPYFPSEELKKLKDEYDSAYHRHMHNLGYE